MIPDSHAFRYQRMNSQAIHKRRSRTVSALLGSRDFFASLQQVSCERECNDARVWGKCVSCKVPSRLMPANPRPWPLDDATLKKRQRGAMRLQGALGVRDGGDGRIGRSGGLYRMGNGIEWQVGNGIGSPQRQTSEPHTESFLCFCVRVPRDVEDLTAEWRVGKLETGVPSGYALDLPSPERYPLSFYHARFASLIPWPTALGTLPSLVRHTGDRKVSRGCRVEHGGARKD